VGFEPTVPLRGQLLSRQPDSTALAPLRKSVRQFFTYHAEDGTRTRTGFHPQAPQACVSTNSTTSASYLNLIGGCYYLLLRLSTVRRFFLGSSRCSSICRFACVWLLLGGVSCWSRFLRVSGSRGFGGLFLLYALHYSFRGRAVGC
jgi:hypothetical protein